MTSAPVSGTYRKHYPDPAARRRAEANYRWLAGLGPARVPRLLSPEDRYLVFGHVSGRPVLPGDLTQVASHLGVLHHAAHDAELHRARLVEPLRSLSGHVIPGFPQRRLAALVRELASGAVPGPALDADQAARLILEACDGPAAFYKDANPRNFLITGNGIVTIDFDDLTLAPFGYDLAKLVVTLAMTHGRLPAEDIDSAISAYNTATGLARYRTGAVDRARLMAFAEIHHILTARFLGRGRYRYAWNTMRPAWPSPTERQWP